MREKVKPEKERFRDVKRQARKRAILNNHNRAEGKTQKDWEKVARSKRGTCKRFLWWDRSTRRNGKVVRESPEEH